MTFERRRDEEKNWLKQLWQTEHLLRVREMEKKFVPRCQSVVAMSAHDAKILRTDWGVEHVFVQPNGIETIDFVPLRKNKPLTIGYIGGAGHPPNVQAVDYIMHDVKKAWPKEWEWHFTLAGAGFANLATNDVNYLGAIESTRDFYAQIDVLVAPLFAGSGTRLKIVEALSCGVPVVTTSVGAEGLDIESPFLRIAKAKSSEFLPNSMVDLIRYLRQNNPRDNKQAVVELKQKLQPFLWREIFKEV